MAGLFGLFDFTKEGPGVQKNEPDKGPFLGTLEIMMRRFWELIKLNLMMIVFQLPALAIGFLGSLLALNSLFPKLSIAALTEHLATGGAVATAQQSLESMAITQLSLLYLILAVGVVATTLIVIGPFQAGFAYILRNYVRDEHVFTSSDFWEHTRANAKQSIITSLISLAVVAVIVFNFAFYYNATDFLTYQIRFVIRIFLVMIALIWLMMQAYLYPMMVTFKLTLKQLYRNSLLFVMLRLPYNFLQLISVLLLSVAVPGFLMLFESGVSVVLALVWYFVFAFSFPQFLSMAIIWPGLKRFMIKEQSAD